jgi:peroxiredoxin
MHHVVSVRPLLRFGAALLALGLGSAARADSPYTEILQATGQARVEYPAPWLAGWTLDNETLNLHALPLAPDAPTTILVFFATWCQPCEVGLSVLRDHVDTLSTAGARVMLVSVDERDVDVRGWLQSRGYVWPTIHDHAHTIARTYGVLRSDDARSSMRLPLTVGIGAEREVLIVLGTEGEDYLNLLVDVAQRQRYQLHAR